MGKRRKQNKFSKQKPDDYFAAGTIEFARFGELIVAKSNATDSGYKMMQDRLAKLFPTVVAEINSIVLGIADIVARQSKDQLLQRAWWEHAAAVISCSENKPEDKDSVMTLRMIDYVQSVIASICPVDAVVSVVSEDDWDALKKLVHDLFLKLTLEYQLCKTSLLRANDPDLDMDFEEFRVRLETYWMNVRGDRYSAHEERALLDVLEPHSDVLIRLFGIDARTIAAELGRILQKQMFGVESIVTDLRELHRDALFKIEQLGREAGISDIERLAKIVLQYPELSDRQSRIKGEFVGVDLFDVEMNTCLPRSLLDHLAWEPGQDKDFFSSGEYAGWPLRVWPTMKRPFIKIDNKILCFDVHSLFDNIYRALQRIVFQLAPSYKQAWNDRQKQVSEQLPFKYFTKLLPGAVCYQQVYYRCKTLSGVTEWNEADGLIIYDDHLFIVEVKAGAFTYTSPATDLQAHIDSLKALVSKPAQQGNRFAAYMCSAKEVQIYDSLHNEIAKLRFSDFRVVTICTITIDSFTELAARSHQLSKLGIDTGMRPVWSVSIDDLRVFADIFSKPLVFLHFVEQRMRAAASDHIEVADEMDHLGLYIARNNYSATRLDVSGASVSPLFHGYSYLIDKYYSDLVQGNLASVPSQEIGHRLAEMIDLLCMIQRRGAAFVASYLLDLSDADRGQICQNIETILSCSAVSMRPSFISTYGERGITICLWPSSARKLGSVAVHHTRVAMAVKKEPSRLLVEIEYADDKTLRNIDWQHVSMAGLSGDEINSIYQESIELRRLRVAKALKQGKIGRNDPCPCGSGKKYKKCCGAKG